MLAQTYRQRNSELHITILIAATKLFCQLFPYAMFTLNVNLTIEVYCVNGDVNENAL